MACCCVLVGVLVRVYWGWLVKVHRLIGRVARVSVETLLLPVVLVIAIEAWWRASSPDRGDVGHRAGRCGCGCGWEE